MIIPILENRLEAIEQLVLDSDEVWLAIAFVRNSGIRLIRPIYLQSNAIFKVLVDTKQRMSERNALMQLLDDGFTIKNFLGVGSFHPKVWLFRKDKIWKVIVGSMNLSLGALYSNIEACVLLHEHDATIFRDWFDNLWNDASKTNTLDRTSISRLPSAIYLLHSATTPETVHVGAPTINTSNRTTQDILNFIKDWTHDRVKVSPGPSMRKTGWTFRPSHGELNQDKLEELQRVLTTMFGSNRVSFDLTEANAGGIIRSAGIAYQRLSHLTSDRQRLVKQQINYLEKLALITKEADRITWDVVKLTTVGRAYIKSSKSQLINFAESALIAYPWFGTNIYDFTKTVLQMLPDNRVHYKEFFLFLRHGGVSDYTFHSPKDIAELIITYRKLTQTEKDSIWLQMENWVNANDTSRSGTSLPNMKNNWAPGIFHDLSLCKEFTKTDKYLSLA